MTRRPEPITNSTLSRIFRDSADSSIVIADGYGLGVSVERGHLIIRDGLGRQRRERRLPRAQRTVRRIVMLGHTGQITLDAVRWCHDIGISLLVLENDGHVLLTTGPAGRDDARLRRAQAAAANSPVGVLIATEMLAAKVDGQASVATAQLGNNHTENTLRDLAADLRDAHDLPKARAIEATASNVYFGAWAGTITATFAKRDLARVPKHWTAFATRRSPITRTSPRSAADPINAMLNYSYALAEAEARLAIQALGLDPGIGIVHTDAKNRDSLALDLLEPLRPIADAHVLALLERRHVTVDDVHETRAGNCRLLPPLTHELADAIPDYGSAAARLAEQLAHALARTVPGKISLTTPLSRVNTANTQVRGARSANKRAGEPGVKARPTCQQCGADLYGSARKLCPTCWPVARKEYMRQLGLARGKPKEAKPAVVDVSGGITAECYLTEILPGLATVSLVDIERATGLTNGSCSRLKRGLQIPNPRYWRALAALAGQ